MSENTSSGMHDIRLSFGFFNYRYIDTGRPGALNDDKDVAMLPPGEFFNVLFRFASFFSYLWNAAVRIT